MSLRPSCDLRLPHIDAKILHYGKNLHYGINCNYLSFDQSLMNIFSRFKTKLTSFNKRFFIVASLKYVKENFSRGLESSSSVRSFEIYDVSFQKPYTHKVIKIAILERDLTKANKNVINQLSHVSGETKSC